MLSNACSTRIRRGCSALDFTTVSLLTRAAPSDWQKPSIGFQVIPRCGWRGVSTSRRTGANGTLRHARLHPHREPVRRFSRLAIWAAVTEILISASEAEVSVLD